MLKDMMNYRILDLMFEGIYVVDSNRVITFWNKQAEKITGFSSVEVIGKHCYDNILKHVDSNGNKLCFLDCPLDSTINDGNIVEADVYLYHKAGHRVPVSIKTIPLLEGDKVIGSMEIFIESSVEYDNEDEVEKYRSLAMKDQLTNIPNRRYTETYLNIKMKEYKELNLPFGIAFIDADHFKYINDTYGHDIGDEILKMLSKTYVNAIRVNDLIGRWGGEEFLAVFSNCSENSLLKRAEKLRMLVENSILKVNNVDVKVTISIGATMVKPDDSLETMIKRADALMYESKSNGRNRCTID